MERIGDTDVFTFGETIEKAKQIDGDNELEPYALLGNGFSVALKANIFSYENLKNGLDTDSFYLKENVLNIFDHLETVDFEKVIKTLEDSFYVSNQYAFEGVENIQNDIELLKNALIEAISASHPSTPDDGINNLNYENNKQFLSHFAKIFTTNYDLLLYWSIIKNQLTTKFTDGFKMIDKKLYWTGQGQELYWLHGGLHLYWEDYINFPNYTEVTKLRKGLSGTNLVDQIREKLNAERFPITITEGSWESKAKKIAKNPYLKDALKELIHNERNIVTYGIGFEQDDHLVRAIKVSPCRKIFIGVYQPDVTSINKLKAKFSPYIAAGKEIYFYRSETATVW